MKKGYTLIEIIFVIIIITIVIWSIWIFVPQENQQKQFWINCSNYIYTQIIENKNKITHNNYYIISWIQYKWTSYGIKRAEWLIKQKNEYEWIGSGIENTLIQSWICNTNIQNQNNYYMFFSWDEWGLILFTDYLEIEWPNNYIDFFSCNEYNIFSTCIPVSRIIFWKWTYNITQKICKNFTWQICNEWST